MKKRSSPSKSSKRSSSKRQSASPGRPVGPSGAAGRTKTRSGRRRLADEHSAAAPDISLLEQALKEPMPSTLQGTIDYTNPDLLQQALLACLRQANRPLPLDEILRITHLPRKAKKKVETALFSLQDQNAALRAPNGWAAPANMKIIQGTLAVQRAGMGFVTRNDSKGPDIYIHPAALGEAWDGDTVEVLVLPGRRGPSVEGRIVKVVQRGLKELAVIATRQSMGGGDWLCVPANPRIPALFQVSVAPPAPAICQDDLLLVVPGDNLAPGMWQATVTANLQHEDSPAAQERLTKSNHVIPSRFPPAALAEAAHLPEDPLEQDVAARRDLRDIAFVTIDGDDARDFDDAVFVQKLPFGFQLLVAIADVGHYVHQGSALDNEARLRGNSYYFPLSVEPMLPEALSNGLCSLRPDQPRLVMVADIEFSNNAQVTKASFYQAVIQSKARLTYGQVQRGLLLGDPEEKQNLTPVLPMLEQAEALARALAAMREARGSLDFDLPEAEIRMDDTGAIVGISPRERHFGHRMIEEFMIAANEAAARFLEHRGQPALYRVHPKPDPDKLSALMTFLSKSGLDAALLPPGKSPGRKGKKTPLPPTATDLRRLMAAASGLPQEYTIHRLVLRSMMQARYSPENEGHFGLASECYCHFTSPIRRYADLVVHRSLKAALNIPPFTGERPLSEARLENIAEHINATERTAMEAEREIHKRLTILYLRDKVGETFDGIVSGITDFGLFVEMPALLTEGMISLGKLHDDFYEYLPDRQELRGQRTRKTFRLGQKMPVLLENVNLGRQEIDLTPAV